MKKCLVCFLVLFSVFIQSSDNPRESQDRIAKGISLRNDIRKLLFFIRRELDEDCVLKEKCKLRFDYLNGVAGPFIKEINFLDKKFASFKENESEIILGKLLKKTLKDNESICSLFDDITNFHVDVYNKSVLREVCRLREQKIVIKK